MSMAPALINGAVRRVRKSEIIRADESRSKSRGDELLHFHPFDLAELLQSARLQGGGIGDQGRNNRAFLPSRKEGGEVRRGAGAQGLEHLPGIKNFRPHFFMAELLLRQIAESLMILGQKASRRKPSLLDRGGVKHRLADQLQRLGDRLVEFLRVARQAETEAVAIFRDLAAFPGTLDAVGKAAAPGLPDLTGHPRVCL